MQSISKLFTLSAFSLLFIVLPNLQAGSRPVFDNSPVSKVTSLNRIDDHIIEKADLLYDSLNLGGMGLSQEAFEYAYKGYMYLVKKGLIEKTGIITICDFSQSSRKKRLYLVDIESREVLMNTYVAHGRNSGGEFANSFSNNPRSHKSSLGFYITSNTYNGGHGLSLRIKGVEKGINDRASQRNIVVHGSDYVGENYLQTGNFMGRSFGCPAVPQQKTKELIELIKDGTCFFIYHPSKNYIASSKIING
ncbi:MAG: hypothetical protein GC171_11705 [Terrimonas sp.]|nr:hypothetical protein [Terrimonas sp.]